MKEGPDIAYLSALIGDPARANMLTVLMSGKALTATELATEAGITQQTASAHLAKLAAGGLVAQRKQGRHRYFSLADADVGSLLEMMMGLAAKKGHTRLRTGPKDPALRQARVCYDHLAGELAVAMFDACLKRGDLIADGEEVSLSSKGARFFAGIGIDLAGRPRSNRPLCRACLDWSARRSHLAGTLGTAILDHIYASKWAKRLPQSRVVQFTPKGEQTFRDAFKL